MRITAVIALCISLLGGRAVMAQTVAPVGVTPATVPVGQGTPVIVTAVITDPAVLAAGVQVVRYDSQGRVVGVLGLLNDDGANGDELAGDKTFSGRLTVYELAPGTFTIRVSAAFQGRILRVLSAPLTLTATGTASTIGITSPTNLDYRNVSPILVTGTVGDPGAQVRINGIDATVGGTTYTAQVPILEGTNTLMAVATNTNGTVTTASVQVTLDTTPPKIGINGPEMESTTSEASIAVSGIVNDIVVGTVNPLQATVTVNGVAAQVSNRSFVRSAVPLVMGPNTIQALATDRSGNSATASVVVTRVPVNGSVALVSGNTQTGPTGTVLPLPLVVRLTNGEGLPAANVPVVFRVEENSGGLVSGSATLGSLAVMTNAQGQASATFRLGTRSGVGNNVVEATATGFAGAGVFTHSATATAAQRIVVDTGNGQVGAVGQALALPFVGIVTDAGFNRIAGVPVSFSVKQGGGSFNGPTTVTTTSDSDGRVAAVLTLGRQEGQDNNVVEATFAGNPGQPAAFLASAKVPADPSQTRITGVVLDNANKPIPGVTMRLFRTHQNTGVPEPVASPVVTGDNGQFVVQPAPVGAFKLMADGSTAPNGPWPALEFDIVTIAGQTIDVGLPIYLPVLDAVNRLCVSETTGGTLTLPQVPGFALTVAPGSATFAGGSRTGCISVTPVNGDKVPMSPGFGQQPRFVVTIQPVGTVFNPSAQLTLPNVDGLAPRQVTEMYSYDHDLSAFVSIGTGTVSEDGSVISSDPGVGVIKAGWHCGGNPNTVGSAGTCPTCQRCQGTACVPAPGSCDDNDSCTENDRCANGSCTGDQIDTSSWTDDLSLQVDARMPPNVVAKINKIFDYIPGLGGIEFTEARLGFSGKAKNCCSPTGGIQNLGLKEGKGTFQLTAQVEKIPLWGTPNVSREIDFGVVIVSIDFQIGVVFTSNFRINGSGGRRTNSCEADGNCFFGEINGSFDPEVKATFEAIACIETLWVTEQCGGVTITPLAIRANFAARLTYNIPDCSSGLDGSVSIGSIVLRAEFQLGIPAGPIRVVLQYELFGGIGQL